VRAGAKLTYPRCRAVHNRVCLRLEAGLREIRERMTSGTRRLQGNRGGSPGLFSAFRTDPDCANRQTGPSKKPRLLAESCRDGTGFEACNIHSPTRHTLGRGPLEAALSSQAPARRWLSVHLREITTVRALTRRTRLAFHPAAGYDSGSYVFFECTDVVPTCVDVILEVSEAVKKAVVGGDFDSICSETCEFLLVS
jgi:hypothetical protein